MTRDAFFGGRLVLCQPSKGHRAGTDAVLLAAAVPRDFSGLCCDVGAGVGAAGLGIALACPMARLRLVERDPFAARLACENIARNALGERCAVAFGDIVRGRRTLCLDPADLVVSNPPFWEADEVRASPHEGRSSAHVFEPGVTLDDWLIACLELLSAKGMLILIHAPAAVPAILARLKRSMGGITLMPVHPHAGQPARRVLVRGTKGSRAPFGIASPLMLHDGKGFTAEAQRLHRGDASLTW